LTLAGAPVTVADPAPDQLVDQRFMRMAIALGERHVGRTWPNPSVGAVIVAPEAEPRIIAQGITGAGGRPHAERIALDAAGEAARGATLYVSLEPCAHHGKTPPCVDAIIAAGIARVVTALEDPDARVRGRGHAVLRDAGIAVTTSVLAAEAGRAHRGHIWRVAQRRPYVTLKLARTADGYAARMSGARLMISDESAIARVHMMRAHADAILVGVGTIVADDPQLTVRLPGLEDRSPVRVIFDSRLRTPLSANVVVGASQAPTWIVTTPGASADAERALVERGVEVMRVAADPDGQLDPRAALALLAERGITRIFSEGGPSLAGCFARADLLDEVMISTSPNALGEPGRPAVGRDLQNHIDAHFWPVWSEMVGPDRLDAFERMA
jgi:diaminohydroxyphosphoribosylaminopyrimidine deaminase / 5-amino-6-(5-phosphoribosylamino)uracil reductase